MIKSKTNRKWFQNENVSGMKSYDYILNHMNPYIIKNPSGEQLAQQSNW